MIVLITVNTPQNLRYPPQVIGFSIHFCLFILVTSLKFLVSIIGDAIRAEREEPLFQRPRSLFAFLKSTNIILSDFGCVSLTLTI